jgi:tetratricopeptide (TPR) repeat protein
MRRAIIGAAIACYAAALIISAAALGVPVSSPAVNLPHRMPATTQAPPREAAAPGAALVPETKTTPTPVGNEPSEEDSLLLLAQKNQLAGDLNKTKAIYLLLLREGKHRDLAAQRLGDLYFDAGEFRRAEELYRESARLLRERNLPAQKPLLP